MLSCPQCGKSLELSYLDFVPIRGRHLVACSPCNALLALPRKSRILALATTAFVGAFAMLAAGRIFLTKESGDAAIFTLLAVVSVGLLGFATWVCRSVTDRLIYTGRSNSP